MSIAMRPVVLTLLFLAAGWAAPARAQYDPSGDLNVPESYDSQRVPAKSKQTDPAEVAARERVRNFLKQLVSGRYPDEFGQFFGDTVRIVNGSVSADASRDEVRRAVLAALAAGGRRQVQTGETSVKGKVVKASWTSSGNTGEPAPGSLGALFNDGQHSATFTIEGDKIAAIEWQ
jgi:hypothetical protein